AELAVREVEVGPTVPVEIRYADGRAERRNVRFDVNELRIERRTVMNEMDAGRSGLVAKNEPRMRDVGRRAHGRGIQPDRGDDCAEKGNGHKEASAPLMARRARRSFRRHLAYLARRSTAKQVPAPRTKTAIGVRLHFLKWSLTPFGGGIIGGAGIRHA